MNLVTKEIDLKDEAIIRMALSECLNILDLIAEFKFSKETKYFIESLFIQLRHLAYYFTRDNSPLVRYKNKLSDNDLIILDKIIDVRIASAHPESDKHWFNEWLMISGSKNFKDNDVEIQYGSSILFLIKDVLYIYKKLREIFSKTSELPRLAKHPHWEQEEQMLVNIEQNLVTLLKDPIKLLENR